MKNILQKRRGKQKCVDAVALETLQLFGQHFNAGTEILPYFPPVLWFELTNNCNLKCNMCLTGLGRNPRPRGFMNETLFARLLDEAARYPVVRTALFFAGEPLLHKECAAYIARAEAAGLNPYLHTNGTIMDDALARQLIESGLQYISFSYDSNIREEYERQRGNADFGQVTRNILCFLRIKAELGSTLPHVTIQKLGRTADDIPDDYRQLFAGLPVDEFRVNCYHNWAGELTGGQQPTEQQTYPCPDPWQRLTVCWNGDVVGCCNDMCGKYIVGNAEKQSLVEIWNDEPIKVLRRKIKNRENHTLELCRNCSTQYEPAWMI